MSNDSKRTARATVPPEDRFWQKVVPTGFCWGWGGYHSRTGYAQFTPHPGDSPIPAHRYGYEQLVGPIPDGLVLDHLCRNRGCVNPDHLQPVTQQENTLRGFGPAAMLAARTHCDKGHEFTPENTTPRANGGRLCRQCERAWRRELTECPDCGQVVTKASKWHHKRRYHS